MVGKEQQITGGRYASKVAGCGYHRSGDPETMRQVRLSLEDGFHVDAYLSEGDAERIAKGDNVMVSIEITRERNEATP